MKGCDGKGCPLKAQPYIPFSAHPYYFFPLVNRTPTFATKHSPFEVVYGVNPYVPIDLISLPKDSYVHGDARQQAEAMVKVHKEVRTNIEKANEMYKRKANNKAYSI